MTHMSAAEFSSVYRFEALQPDLFRVREGVNQGDPIEDNLTPCLGDIYTTKQDPWMVEISASAQTPVSDASDLMLSDGTPASILAQLTFMTSNGAMLKALLIGCDDKAGQRCLCPFTPVKPRTDYTLIAMDTALCGASQLAELAETSTAIKPLPALRA